VTLLARLPPIANVPSPIIEASASSAESQQAPPFLGFSHAEAHLHPQGPFLARLKMFPNGGDPRAHNTALYDIDTSGKGHYSAWCSVHLRRRNEDALILRPHDGNFICKNSHFCKVPTEKKSYDSRSSRYQTSGPASRGDFRSSAQYNQQQGPTSPSAQTAGSSHQAFSTPSAQAAGNSLQGQVVSTPSAQSQGGDLWRDWKPCLKSINYVDFDITAAQDSIIEHGSSSELGSISSLVAQHGVPSRSEHGSSSSALAPQVGPLATLSSVFSAPVSLAPIELSPSASAEVISSCTLVGRSSSDIRLKFAPVAAALDAPQF